MITRASTSDAFFKALSPFFSQHGFELLPVLNQFRKDRDGGFTNIIFSITEANEGLSIECTFGCRINLVEETVMPFSNGVNGYQEESNTTITNLAKFLNRPGFRLRITNSATFNTERAFVERFFLDEGFSFLAAQTEVALLEPKFNFDPKQASLYAFNHQLRAFRGITLATIAQNVQWEKLRISYNQLLHRYGTPPIIIDKYDRLCNHLAGISLN